MINNLPGSVLMLYNAESVNKKNTAGLRISEGFFFFMETMGNYREIGDKCMFLILAVDNQV